MTNDEIRKELPAAFASLCLDALFEVPDRFGVGDAVNDAKAVELLQHEDVEQGRGVKRRLAALAPVA